MDKRLEQLLERKFGRPTEFTDEEHKKHADYCRNFYQKNKEAMRRYSATPEAKEKRRKYRQEYNRRPEVIEYRRARERQKWAETAIDLRRAANRRLTLKHYYGLTVEQYEAMLAAQPNCPICGRDLIRLPQSGRHYPHVDHDHATKQVRGILCGWCNIGIGAFGDSPERLRAAALYLEKAKEGAPAP
jgi:recombination endonuclease VII